MPKGKQAFISRVDNNLVLSEPYRRAFSSVGRASPLQGEGQKFESSNAHHKGQDNFLSCPLLYTVRVSESSRS